MKKLVSEAYVKIREQHLLPDTTTTSICVCMYLYVCLYVVCLVCSLRGVDFKYKLGQQMLILAANGSTKQLGIWGAL